MHRAMHRFLHQALRALRFLVTLPIIIYQHGISPMLPGGCIYAPSCSHYAREAVMRHGILRGLLMGVLRVFRCSSLFSGGYDPVPDTFSVRDLLGKYSEFWDRNEEKGSGDRHEEEGHSDDEG